MILLSLSHERAQGRKILMKSKHLGGDHDHRGTGESPILSWREELSLSLKNRERSWCLGSLWALWQQMWIRLNFLISQWHDQSPSWHEQGSFIHRFKPWLHHFPAEWAWAFAKLLNPFTCKTARIKSASQACHKDEMKPYERSSLYSLLEIRTSVQFPQLDYNKPLDNRGCSGVSSLSQQGFRNRIKLHGKLCVILLSILPGMIYN